MKIVSVKAEKSKPNLENSGIVRKRTRLSFCNKMDVLQKSANMSVQELSDHYNCSPTAIYSLLKNKSELQTEWQQYNVEMKNKPRVTENEQINVEVLEWFRAEQAKGSKVVGSKLQAKAREIAKAKKIDFKASNGWLQSFRKRHSVPSTRNMNKTPKREQDTEHETSNNTTTDDDAMEETCETFEIEVDNSLKSEPKTFAQADVVSFPLTTSPLPAAEPEAPVKMVTSQSPAAATTTATDFFSGSLWDHLRNQLMSDETVKGTMIALYMTLAECPIPAVRVEAIKKSLSSARTVVNSWRTSVMSEMSSSVQFNTD